MSWTIPDEAHPIIFTPELVRAILDKRKTVTRRLVIPQPERADAGPGSWRIFEHRGKAIYRLVFDDEEAKEALRERMPKRWKPGALCYVREGLDLWPGKLCYQADGEPLEVEDWEWFDGYTRASCTARYAPKWTSRILLGIKDSRPERLHEIDDKDAQREGVSMEEGTFLSTFQTLWDKVNAGRASWESNPWLYRVEFELKEVRAA